MTEAPDRIRVERRNSSILETLLLRKSVQK
jgi:hypothetical protein